MSKTVNKSFEDKYLSWTRSKVGTAVPMIAAISVFVFTGSMAAMQLVGAIALGTYMALRFIDAFRDRYRGWLFYGVVCIFVISIASASFYIMKDAFSPNALILAAMALTGVFFLILRTITREADSDSSES